MSGAFANNAAGLIALAEMLIQTEKEVGIAKEPEIQAARDSLGNQWQRIATRMPEAFKDSPVLKSLFALEYLSIMFEDAKRAVSPVIRQVVEGAKSSAVDPVAN